MYSTVECGCRGCDLGPMMNHGCKPSIPVSCLGRLHQKDGPAVQLWLPAGCELCSLASEAVGDAYLVRSAMWWSTGVRGLRSHVRHGSSCALTGTNVCASICFEAFCKEPRLDEAASFAAKRMEKPSVRASGQLASEEALLSVRVSASFGTTGIRVTLECGDTHTPLFGQK